MLFKYVLVVVFCVGCIVVIYYFFLKMYVDLFLYLYIEECNVLINLFKECYKNYNILKFFGYCNDFDWDVRKCLRNEYI